MKLFSVMILYKGDPAAHILKAAFDLASFSFFQRSSVQEFINFTAKVLAERTQIGERQGRRIHVSCLRKIRQPCWDLLVRS